jgi:hypothetical protein
MVHACTAYKTQTGMDCVGLLMTDGAPTECNGDANYLSGILSTAAAAGIKTFVVGLPGGNITLLNQLAQAGGTNAAIDLTGGTSQASLLAALNTVRQQSTTVTSTQLPCDWGVPAGIDAGLTNLEFTPDTTAASPTIQQLGHVSDASVCANAVGDAWYYDNNSAPTKVTVCPSTCTTITAAPNPQMSLIFGCSTVEAPIR